MRVSAFITCLFAFVPILSAAAATEFPYEAVVESDRVVVRSGPGERYDPTLKLNTGNRVTVHRHDPGGWFMIAPPPGSFSWIDAAYVTKTGPETGIVKVPSNGDALPPRVVVWIGSQFTNEHKYFGRQLANGDEVRILGEETTPGDRGMQTFYRIAPPRLEYRWIKGDFIVPLSEAGRIEDSTPFATPAMPTETTATTNETLPLPLDRSFADAPTLSPPGFSADTPKLLERELTRGIDAGAVRSSGPSSDVIASEQKRLYELDDELKAMVALSPEQWDLDRLEQSYRQLQRGAPSRVAAQVDTRLNAIASRRKVKTEYDAFINVTNETARRDAELLSMQQSLANGTLASGQPVDPTGVELGQASSFPQQVTNGTAPVGVPTLPRTQPPIPVPDLQASATTPQMNGAGIIQRVPRPLPGLPQHVLLAPDGRPLAYLHPGQNIQLDRYIGQSLGVIGRRSHDPRLRADVIVVERLTPVRLQP